MMMRVRQAGVLVHPTSLPGRFGSGDLGPATTAFLDWASRAGQSVWQILPLVPTGEGGSPYGGLSAFAGNPLLVSPEVLVEEGLLPAERLEGAPRSPPGRVDYTTELAWKREVLRASWDHFGRHAPQRARKAFEEFRGEPAQAYWLEDWTLFRAVRDRYARKAWVEWDEGLRRRLPEALDAARRELRGEIDFEAYVQFLFFRQWERVREEARKRRIRIFGDVPIYVAHDSADVWARPDLFELDGEGRPLAVAGVPPDYFSATGQLWSNPLYRWDRMAEDGYAWWVERMRANLRLADIVRLDHFRGFAAYWSVPASERTAVGGTWIPGPGVALFAALRDALGGLPLVAEDLGLITEDVHELRETLDLPGMAVLQFAFDELDSSHLPHRHVPRAVVYTGTHDNDTTVGWYGWITDEVRQRVADYLGGDGSAVHWDLIRAAYASVAELAIVPLQDVFGLKSEARMNVPGQAEGNWAWRALPSEFREDAAGRLRRLAELTGRIPPKVSARTGS